MTKPKKIVIFVLVFLVIFCISANYFMLQRNMNNTLNNDTRNKGISVWVHYKWFINPFELKYDVRDVSKDNSTLDVNRVMLQFSERIKEQKFKKVYLSYRGEDKFYFNGDYFQKLGKDYEFQNPIYTLRTIPENVYSLDNSKKYGTWEGGMLGVLGKQLEDLNSFAKDWYLDDIFEKSNTKN